jgi:hypothetical protein
MYQLLLVGVSHGGRMTLVKCCEKSVSRLGLEPLASASGSVVISWYHYLIDLALCSDIDSLVIIE